MPVVDSVVAIEQLELLKTQAIVMHLGQGGINQHGAVLEQEVIQQEVLTQEKHCSGCV